MSSDTFWLALGLVFIIEGLFPFLSPSGWRDAFLRMTQMRDGQIRFAGMVCLVLGLGLLWFMTP